MTSCSDALDQHDIEQKRWKDPGGGGLSFHGQTTGLPAKIETTRPIKQLPFLNSGVVKPYWSTS